MKQLEHKLVIISTNFSKKGISGRKQKMNITIAFVYAMVQNFTSDNKF